MNDALATNDILLVDDTPDNLRLLSGLLKEQGYKVRSVTSGAMALTVVETAPPDLIFLDINMPDMNGLVFLRELSRKFPSTSVIMITAYGGVESYLEAMNLVHTSIFTSLCDWRNSAP